jgi:hypothetical protein
MKIAKVRKHGQIRYLVYDPHGPDGKRQRKFFPTREANDVSAEALKAADARARERVAKAKAKGPTRRGEFTPGAETAGEEGWSGFAWKHNALRHSFIT